MSGLSEGSSVRYLGVVVGRVAHIGIDPREARRVRVVADIDAEAPIGADTVARLTLQGVTGLLFVDLRPRSPGTLPGIATREPQVSRDPLGAVAVRRARRAACRTSWPRPARRSSASMRCCPTPTSARSRTRSPTPSGRAQELPMAVAEAREMFGDLQGAANEMDKTDGRARYVRRRGHQGALRRACARSRTPSRSPPRASISWWQRTRATWTASRARALPRFEQLLREARSRHAQRGRADAKPRA